MSSIDIIAYCLSAKYTDESIEGGGALKGKNCVVDSITAIDGGSRVTFKWYLDSGEEQTGVMDVMNGAKGDDGDTGADGRGIKSSYINQENHFIIVYDDDTEEDCGEITVVCVDTLDELADVDIDEPSDGQTLVYDEEIGKWKNGAGGGGTDAVLSDDLTTAISVGGIDSGVTYEKDTPLETLFRDLLEPTLFPTLTNPSASITYNSSQYYEVKSTVSAMQGTVALNRGSINPQYTAESSYRSGEATGYAIATSGADTEYSDSSESSGAFSVPALTRSTKGNIVVTGTASYAQGAQPKDSKGKDYNTPLPAGSVSANKTLTFIQAYFYGASNSATVADFTGLSKSVTAKGNKTFTYSTDNEYMVCAFDKAYGSLKSILDGNGFETIGGWTKSEVTVDGFAYFVYVSNSPTTDNSAPFTFKF